MAKTIQIPSKVIFGGDVKGAGALVSPVNFSFFAGVDPANGNCNDPHNVLYGQNVTGKVMVFRAGKSSTANCTFLYTMSMRGIAPAAVITCVLDPITVMGQICGEIPLYKVDEEKFNITELIATGDTVDIDGKTGMITVTKKED